MRYERSENRDQFLSSSSASRISSLASVLLAAAFAIPGCAAFAQQSMGSVATHDALVTGGLEVHGEKANLLSNTSITAYSSTAPIDLERGGEVLVCATSEFHLLHSGGGESLSFGLDRGAIEIHSPSQPQDVILTPDLRFTLATQGKLDLRVRVTRDGDTCVDNAGAEAPTLQISDVFSNASYNLTAGQHVMFEHGDLHQVVDRETSSCGCPAEPSVAVAASGSPAAVAAAQNPFPTAVSQGLAPESVPANTPPPGQEHVQVASTLAYGATQPEPPAAAPPKPAAPPVQAAAVSTEPPPSPPGARDIFHAVGRFFKRLFGKS
jgi:hypothetical protein